VRKARNTVIGYDVGGAHLKAVKVEDGRVVAAVTVAMPLWLGLDRLTVALDQAAPLVGTGDRAAFTMTGELSDIFSSREIGVATLLDRLSAYFPKERKLIYAGPAGLVGVEAAAAMPADVASANWHATATTAARYIPDGLFVDMGSTTTDIIALRDGRVANHGYTDAARLQSGELVYTGFTRTFLFGVASSAPVRGRLTPLMNEYFASMADVHRLLGVLDEADDKHPAADGKDKTAAGSTARVARMVGRDAGDLAPHEWRDVALWFSERQLRSVHDAAMLVSTGLGGEASVVAAGAGRWQIRRLAGRLERPFVDFADLIPADDGVRIEASNAAAAAAVALIAAEVRD